MPAPPPPTRPLLDVLEVLLDAFGKDVLLDGWTIAHRSRRSGPTVYKVIDRLEDAEWISAKWEETGSDASGHDRRRLYQLKPNATAAAGELLRDNPRRKRAPWSAAQPGIAHSRISTI
jgi:PadR family transcriptional regulator, regulatory protein PadR